MATFRVEIDADPEGFSQDQERELEARRFTFRAAIPYDERATWTGEERPISGCRYIYEADALDADEAGKIARAIVGTLVRIRISPQGSRTVD